MGAGFPVVVRDDAGREVTIAAPPKRIVSLAPANTEIIAALGLRDELVGVTTYDDYPPEVRRLPKVGDLINPNIEAIAGASPDLVLVTAGVQADVIGKLEAVGAKVVAVDPQSVSAVFRSIEMVGKATGRLQGAAAIVGKMRARLAVLQAELAGKPPVAAFIEIGQNPLFTAGKGTLLDDLIRLAGGRNVVKAKGYVGYSLERLLKDDPAVYMATRGSSSDPADLLKRSGYARLTAVRTRRVAILDDSLVSRGGPRIIDGVEQIARALHPGLTTP